MVACVRYKEMLLFRIMRQNETRAPGKSRNILAPALILALLLSPVENPAHGYGLPTSGEGAAGAAPDPVAREQPCALVGQRIYAPLILSQRGAREP